MSEMTDKRVAFLERQEKAAHFLIGVSLAPVAAFIASLRYLGALDFWLLQAGITLSIVCLLAAALIAFDHKITVGVFVDFASYREAYGEEEAARLFPNLDLSAETLQSELDGGPVWFWRMAGAGYAISAITLIAIIWSPSPFDSLAGVNP
ncbi:MAG: hypothetical protein AAFN79_06595 [Pseudomonadota bacterium]